MKKYFAVYHRIDGGSDDMFETCMASFRRQSDAEITVVTDNIKQKYRDEITKKYGIVWLIVPSMDNRRALAKVEHLRDFVYQCSDGDIILAGDIDLYFCDSPWPVFADFAVTERFYQYVKPINGGVFYIRVSDKIRKFMDFHCKWSADVASPYGKDWTVGQAFLCFIALKRQMIEKQHKISLTVLGSEWNYCPGSDVFTEKGAIDRLKKAYNTGIAHILHFKSELKKCIYDGWLDKAITTNGLGVTDWQKGL